jgi:hypothetical protein
MNKPHRRKTDNLDTLEDRVSHLECALSAVLLKLGHTSLALTEADLNAVRGHGFELNYNAPEGSAIVVSVVTPEALERRRLPAITHASPGMHQ